MFYISGPICLNKQSKEGERIIYFVHTCSTVFTWDDITEFICPKSVEALFSAVFASSFKVSTPDVYLSVIFLSLDSRNWVA